MFALLSIWLSKSTNYRAQGTEETACGYWKSTVYVKMLLTNAPDEVDWFYIILPEFQADHGLNIFIMQSTNLCLISTILKSYLFNMTSLSVLLCIIIDIADSLGILGSHKNKAVAVLLCWVKWTMIFFLIFYLLTFSLSLFISRSVLLPPPTPTPSLWSCDHRPCCTCEGKRIYPCGSALTFHLTYRFPCV